VSLKRTCEESWLSKSFDTLQGIGAPQGAVSLSKPMLMGAADAPNAAMRTASEAMLLAIVLLT
jgi:hypothetical protein